MGEMHRGVGSTAKSAVDRSHVAAINRVMTPSTDEVCERRMPSLRLSKRLEQPVKTAHGAAIC